MSTLLHADHPLSPLGPDEISVAADVLRTAGMLDQDGRISYLGLEEPPKSEVLAGGPLPRLARALVINISSGLSHSVIISITDKAIVSQEPIDPVTAGQVPLLPEEHKAIRDLMATDPRWIEALAARGISDPGKVCLAALSAGNYDLPGESGVRMARVLGHHQPTPETMPWAHPIDGLVCYVDLISRTVLDVIDTGPVPIPTESGDYHVPGAFGETRTTQKPIVITQPEGPSFSVDGTLINWEKWSFRIGYDMREGLVLHQVGFDDQGRTRPIVYRASVAEMVVPYGDPSPVRFWQNYFDTGEYQLGGLVNSLELGCDCVGEISYFDVAVAGADGTPTVLPNAICMHEEDAGVLWKHTEVFTGSSDVRRQRRLVISFFTTIGNYDYGFYWYLYLDGTIELEAKATGLVFTSVYDERSQKYASELAPGLAAPYHQHLFSARLDMMVDGVVNAVDEVDVTPVPVDEANPWGNAIGRTSTRLGSESQGARIADNRVDRTWRISNPGVNNRLGRPVSYQLFPEGKQLLAADPGSVIAARAAFATKHLWVTQYHPDERYPAGTIVNQSTPGQGLPAYVAQDRNLDGTDLVLWHTFGLTHFPRTEDWPIMPVDQCGFTLKPDGFFDRNPTLDVPASGHHDHCAPTHDHQH